jgi:hypothetical protein
MSAILSAAEISCRQRAPANEEIYLHRGEMALIDRKSVADHCEHFIVQ